jgi:hypothetical protein
MKHNLLGMVLVGVVVFGCNGSTDTGVPVVLQVSQISAPASVAAGSSFGVNLSVGVGSCLVFDHIEIRNSASDILLTVWGTDVSGVPVSVPPGVGDLSCAPPKTEVRSVTVEAGSPGTLTLVVERGRLSPLTTAVLVQ